MARKGEGGCYRNLSSNMLLFAHGPPAYRFPPPGTEDKLATKNFSGDSVPAPQLVSSPFAPAQDLVH